MSQSVPLDPKLQTGFATLAQARQTVLENLARAAEDRWQRYQSSVASELASTDVNALVLLVLREAYRDNQRDLAFFAEKVKFYNDLQTQLRAQVTRAREQALAPGVSGAPAGTSDPRQQALLAMSQRLLAGELAVLQQQAALLQKRTEQLSQALGDVPA
jgi:hypothetical protein